MKGGQLSGRQLGRRRMKIFEKVARRNWKNCKRLAILQTLCLLVAGARAVYGQDAERPEPADLRLQEAQMARQAAEQESAELRAALAQTEKELENLRRRFAALYLSSREQQKELEYFELRVAGLLTDAQDPSTGRALSQALAAVDRLREIQQELARRLREFETYLRSVLDVLQPSEVLRREVTERFDELIALVEQSVRPPSKVARRGGGSVERRKCRVLAVNDELQVVVLDSGFDSGVRQGTYWRVTKDSTVLARLRVIEVRPSLSAAVVVDGRFKAVGPGALVVAGE